MANNIKKITDDMYPSVEGLFTWTKVWINELSEIVDHNETAQNSFNATVNKTLKKLGRKITVNRLFGACVVAGAMFYVVSSEIKKRELEARVSALEDYNKYKNGVKEYISEDEGEALDPAEDISD